MGRERASDGGGCMAKSFRVLKGLFDGVAAAFAAGRPGRAWCGRGWMSVIGMHVGTT
jgi:hypothetical protein